MFLRQRKRAAFKGKGLPWRSGKNGSLLHFEHRTRVNVFYAGIGIGSIRVEGSRVSE